MKKKTSEIRETGGKTHAPTHGASKDTPLSPINFFKIIKNKKITPPFFSVSNFGAYGCEGVRYVRIDIEVPYDGG